MPSPLLPPHRAGAGFLGESWHAWTALAIGVVSISAQTASSMTFSVLMKPLLADFGWARTDFTAAMTLRMTVMVLLIAYAGLLTDRIGARFVLAAGAVIIGVGSLAMARITSMPELYAVMAWLGAGQAAINTVAASALVVRLFERRRNLAVGILNGADNLLNSGVYYLAAVLLAAWGWRPTIVTLGSIYLLLAVLILWALRRGSGEAATAAAEPARREVRLRDVPWGDRRLWVLCLTYALIYAFITSVQLHLHAFLTDLGHSPLDAAQILSILTLVGAVGAPLFGFVAERTNARAALIIVVAGLASTSVVLWTARGLGAFTVWAVIYGLVNSGVVALLALILDEFFGTAQIGRLMGVAMVFCMTATMIGNNFSAAVFERTGSYDIAWQSYTALMVVTLVPVVWLGRQATRPTNAIAAPSGSVGA
jgi:MFS family permease